MNDRHPIYLNHAGTSWPKPGPAIEATQRVFANPPQDWPELFDQAHRGIAEFFHVDPSRLLLTPSCTAALDLAISDHAWQAGDRVITTSFEHHAMIRPLMKLEPWGVEVRRLPPRANALVDLDALDAALKAASPRLVAVTAASNVTGQLVPLPEIIAMAHDSGALVLVDGAQVAGWWDLDVPSLGADLFTFAGHKGPHAPWGVGGLIVAPHVTMNSPLAVCEVTRGETCATMPGYCDAGSVNLAAVAGMHAACDWLRSSHPDRLTRARRQAQRLADAVRELPSITVYGDVEIEGRMPTVAITSSRYTTPDLGRRLADAGVIASAGFQCAAEAHQSLGTAQTGVVRFSVGPSTDDDEIQRATAILRELTDSVPRREK